jgi:RimJ/RimL family protein N-acetyltransferase
MIETSRLTLRRWEAHDRVPFAGMNADPDVMHDLGGPISRAESDAKFDRYAAAFARDGVSRWVLEGRDGRFLGYTGVLYRRGAHPLGPHHEIGWRLTRAAWGHGYATEAAKAALDDAFTRAKLKEIFSYTSPDNLRSQAVTARLGLTRDSTRDFTADYGHGDWHGRVWIARRLDSAALCSYYVPFPENRNCAGSGVWRTGELRPARKDGRGEGEGVVETSKT